MKNLFWKVMGVVFIIWLFLWLWNSSICCLMIIDRHVLKVNKITGRTYLLIKGKGWERYDLSKKSPAIEKEATTSE